MRLCSFIWSGDLLKMVLLTEHFYQRDLQNSHCENPSRDLYSHGWQHDLCDPNQGLQIVANVSFLTGIAGCPRPRYYSQLANQRAAQCICCDLH